MNLLIEKFNSLSLLERWIQICFLLYAFLFPFTVAGGNLLLFIILSLWMVSPNLKDRFFQLTKNKVVIASVLFFFTHLLGLFWSENIDRGILNTKKMLDFLIILPLLISIARQEFVKIYIATFNLSIFIVVTLSYLIYFEIIEPFHYAHLSNPTPNMSHISYNIFLNLSLYTLIHGVLWGQIKFSYLSIIKTAIIILFAINIFLNGGRTGQLMFFVMIFLILLQYYGLGKLKGYLISLFVIFSLVFFAFILSDKFQTRIIAAYDNFSKYISHNNPYSSVGQRIAWAKASLKIFNENIFIGAGTGDLKDSMEALNDENINTIGATHNPHNMYFLLMGQLGVIGLISLIYLFFTQISFAFTIKEHGFERDLAVSLPLLYLFIMFGESYLLGHHTTHLFTFFSAFLYKKFE